MAAALSVHDYIQHFLFNRDKELSGVRKRIESEDGAKSSSSVRRYSDAHLPAPLKRTVSVPPQNHGLLLAHVYQTTRGGKEDLIYSKRIPGHKSMDVFGIFVQDMIGSKGMKASQMQDGRLSRGSSLSDVSSISVLDIEEGQLQPNTVISIRLTSSRSPSNIGSAELMGLLDFCKRNNIRVGTHLQFAHAYTWDNKYNREGLENLHARGVKLNSLSLPQMLQSVFDDVKENMESLDHLQTCRGTIAVDGSYLEQAVSTFRRSVTIGGDFYHQDQREQLAEIIGHKNELPQYKKFRTSELPAVFSLETYREHILLQNMDIEWVKLKVGVTKVATGVTKEEVAYERVFTTLDKPTTKHQKTQNKDEKLDMGLIWEKLGKKVNMTDLSECEQIVLTVNALLSEYNGRIGWVDELTQLHNFLRDKAEESEIYKVRVETTVRYAHSLEGPLTTRAMSESKNYAKMNGVADGHAQIGFPRGMRLECLHVQEIMFEMLEDLEDNVRHLGGLEYGRGANLYVEDEGLARAMGLLNKAISIKTADGVFSMNDEFTDEYADDLNGA